jgi:predicted GH43/DUF377 family glycosyl hydrolase
MLELGPFHKHKGNPILEPQGIGWESHAVFNPTAWTDGKTVYMFYRAEGPNDHLDKSLSSLLFSRI